MRVNTMSYKRSHGKSPRGYGMWAFEINREEYFITGTYSEAKTKAIKLAKSKKAFEVRVLS